MAAAVALADPDRTAERETFVAKCMEALSTPDLGTALVLSELAKKSDKPAAITHLEEFAMALAVRAKDVLGSAPRESYVAATRYAIALATLRAIDANASLQLALEAMFIKMRAV